jgi:hypothetical protein
MLWVAAGLHSRHLVDDVGQISAWRRLHQMAAIQSGCGLHIQFPLAGYSGQRGGRRIG